MVFRSQFAGCISLIAAVSMAASPAYAAQTSQNAPQGVSTYGTDFLSQFSKDAGHDGFRGGYDEQSETAQHHRYRRGWRRGWRGHRRHRSRTGDVLTGILVLGGIAAIASAASNNNRRRERETVYVDRDSSRYDSRRTDRSSNRRSNSGSGLDNAVSMCLNEIERDVRVESVDGASRIAQGWVVSGSLFNGSGFTCQIDNNGRISTVDYNGFAASQYPTQTAQDNQLSDSSYADARAAVRNQRFAQSQPSSADEPRPAYPGGPLPGESFED